MIRYSAWWLDDRLLLFEGRRKEQVRDCLPRGAVVRVDVRSTLGCLEGDEYEYAMFDVRDRVVVVSPDAR